MRKTLLTLAALAALAASAPASAANVYINLGTNYDTLPTAPFNFNTILGITPDADAKTAVFTEFGYTGTKATSVYDLSDGSPFGAFYDTNLKSDLNALGMVDLPGPPPHPLSPGERNIESLNSISAANSGQSAESYGYTWKLMYDYKFYGTLSPFGPQYTSGELILKFVDMADPLLTETPVLKANLTGSQVQGVNLQLYFDIVPWDSLNPLNSPTKKDFLFAQDEYGNFKDVGLVPSKLEIDTNVKSTNPNATVIPTLGDLTQVTIGGQTWGYRQTLLDGSATVSVVPEPSSIALLGLGLVGLGLKRRRKDQPSA